MRFKQFLELQEAVQEDIPFGVKNKELWFDYLKEKYSGKDVSDLYITFVYVDKVGINPKTIFSTPIGVYSYPMEFILDEEDVPYRGELKPKKIKVIKSISKKFLSDELSSTEYNTKIKELIKLTKVSDEDIEKFEKSARKKTYFGKLWNVTRMVSKEDIVKWSRLLINLGYDYVVDNGFGVIHPSESTQAVFLNPKSYKVIDEEFVDTEERYKSTQGKLSTKTLENLKKYGWKIILIKELISDKQYKFLKIIDDDGLDALQKIIFSQENGLFDKVINHFMKNGKLENITKYLNFAMSKLSKTNTVENDNHILDKLLSLGDIDFRNIGINKLLQYLETPEKFGIEKQNIKNKEELIKSLKKFIKAGQDSLEGLDDALKGTK
jgi:hypothetical protein